MTQSRIRILDAARGLAVILMTAYHILFDLVEFADFPPKIMNHPLTEALHLSAYIFIFMAGICCNLSKNNLRRGIRVFAAALALTAVTCILQMPILFGVLHLLGLCMILYGLFPRFFERLPIVPTVLVCAVLFTVTKILSENTLVESRFLWMFGFRYRGFSSADYYPLLPWIFLFTAGTVTGQAIVSRRFPDWFYKLRCGMLEGIGRRAFLIYLVHQPIIYGVLYVIFAIIRSENA